jgi:hypothetical protein
MVELNPNSFYASGFLMRRDSSHTPSPIFPLSSLCLPSVLSVFSVLVFPKNEKSRRPEGAGAGLVDQPLLGQTTV